MYCDFASYAGMYDTEDAYVEALLFEMRRYWGTTVDSVYIGGGTPSSLSETSIDRILNGIHRIFHFAVGTEFTVEVNPASSLRAKLLALKNGGVNRLSIGMQSLVDAELIALGRLHDRREALRALLLTRGVGFQNVNVDLMLAIPGQTLQSIDQTLTDLYSFSPDHISAYSLIIEPDTPFATMKLQLPTESEERDIYWHVAHSLEANGYHHYEISNFSKPGQEARHNLKYWSGDDYIGIGAGAHSFQNAVRFSHTTDIKHYIASPLSRENYEYISAEERQKEYFLLGLRKREGIPYHGEFPDIINRHIKNGLLETTNSNLRLTDRGIDLANQVWMDFV